MPANKDSTATIGTKWAIKNATGGDTLALAIAMLETSDLRSGYPFGDVTTDKYPKTGDAANFGIYKMNWYMIQQLRSATNGTGPYPPPFNLADAWAAVGATINNDPTLATIILKEAMATWSTNPPVANQPVADNFWAGHRQGQSGLDNPTNEQWADIIGYYTAVQSIKAACGADADVWTSNVRYWVEVGPV
jgi:hypothetical protein